LSCKSLLIVVITLGLSIATTASADTMRCGRRLIRPGDSKARVLARCGEPISRDYIGTDTHINYSSGNVSERTVEEWTYNFGPSKFMRILRFRSGRLIWIRDGDRGF
jgi:hypothetical protein